MTEKPVEKAVDLTAEEIKARDVAAADAASKAHQKPKHATEPAADEANESQHSE
jgi:hypothetical protein